MGNSREFMLKKKVNTNAYELATKRVRRPQGPKAFIMNYNFSCNIRSTSSAVG